MYRLPYGCGRTAPIFTTSTIYILHVDCGRVPHERGQHLALAYYLKNNGQLPYSVFTQKFSVPQFLTGWSHKCGSPPYSTYNFYILFLNFCLRLACILLSILISL